MGALSPTSDQHLVITDALLAKIEKRNFMIPINRYFISNKETLFIRKEKT